MLVLSLLHLIHSAWQAKALMDSATIVGFVSDSQPLSSLSSGNIPDPPIKTVLVIVYYYKLLVSKNL